MNPSNFSTDVDLDTFDDLLQKSEPLTDPHPNFSAELKSLPIFLHYKLVPKKSGKGFDKIPYQNGVASNDRAKDVPYSEAVKFLETHKDEYNGIGLHVPEGFFCVDLDACVNAGGVESWAEEIINTTPVYWEQSPSNTGIHGWGKGSKPGPKCRNGRVEIYDGSSTRFITVTGRSLHNPPRPVREFDLSLLYDKFLRDGSNTNTSSVAASSIVTTTTNPTVQIQSQGTSATSKLDLLMGGIIESEQPFVIHDSQGNRLSYDSWSEVEMAFCNLSGFKHRDAGLGDKELEDAIWSDYVAWPLRIHAGREKWIRREKDFRGLTVAKAIAGALASQPEATTKPPTTAVSEGSSLWELATPFNAIEDTPMEWILPGLIVKGETTMMTGDFGSFKTYMTYFMADAISEGGQFIKRQAQRHPVLVLDRENSKSTVSLRRYLVGDLRHKTNVKLLGRFTEPKAPNINDPALLELCRTIRPFILVDSMQDFHPGKKENDTDDMTAFSLEVNGLIDAGAVGVLIIHHIPKTGKGKGGMYRGTTAIPGGVGGALFVEKVNRLGVKITGFKTRDGEDSEIELLLKFPSAPEMENKTGRVTYTILRSGLDRVAEIKAAIMGYVKGSNQAEKPIYPSKNQISKNIGGDRNEILTLVDQLVAEGQLIRREGEGFALIRL